MDLQNEVLVSPASYWEIAIKISRKKYSLDVDEDFATFMQREIQGNLLAVLPISVQHAGVVAAMPFHHQDPFDRLLIAQSMVEQIPIISADTVLDAYGVDRRW
jgi:PIN domain nuclease of toxin-antitoxin system